MVQIMVDGFDTQGCLLRYLAFHLGISQYRFLVTNQHLVVCDDDAIKKTRIHSVFRLSGFGEISAEKGKQPIKIEPNPMLGTKVSAVKNQETANAPVGEWPSAYHFIWRLPGRTFAPLGKFNVIR